jgi:hypothetical protein
MCDFWLLAIQFSAFEQNQPAYLLGILSPYWMYSVGFVAGV